MTTCTMDRTVLPSPLAHFCLVWYSIQYVDIFLVTKQVLLLEIISCVFVLNVLSVVRLLVRSPKDQAVVIRYSFFIHMHTDCAFKSTDQAIFESTSVCTCVRIYEYVRLSVCFVSERCASSDCLHCCFSQGGGGTGRLSPSTVQSAMFGKMSA